MNAKRRPREGVAAASATKQDCADDTSAYKIARDIQSHSDEIRWLITRCCIHGWTREAAFLAKLTDGIDTACELLRLRAWDPAPAPPIEMFSGASRRIEQAS